MRAQIFGAVLTLSIVGSQHTGSAESKTLAASDMAFRFFATLRTASVGSALEHARPLPINREDKRRALSGLPADGQVQPTPDEVAKLSSVRPVLIYHKRQDVYEIRVIDLPQAGIVLHARSILLITRPVLRLLSSTELQAVVAHEVGHEYFWSEFWRLRDAGDARGLRELELRCDGISVLTLLELQAEPQQLVSAVGKITNFNDKLGATVERAEHPTTSERAQFARRIVNATASNWR
jgi:hypothetical protein